MAAVQSPYSSSLVLQCSTSVDQKRSSSLSLGRLSLCSSFAGSKVRVGRLVVDHSSSRPSSSLQIMAITKKAVAVLKGTADVTRTVTLVQENEGPTVVTVKLQGLTPGKHGFHLDGGGIVRAGGQLHYLETSAAVYVPPHPLIKHFVSILRNEVTPPALFRSAMAELGRLLIYEASRDWLITVSGDVQTPCGVASVEFIDPREPVKVVPILRAGLVLVEQVATVLPATQTYHLGYVRDEETLLPKLYLNKLPEKFPENSRVLVTDPMLATGGTIVAAIEELVSRGVNHKLIRVIAAVAAPPALEKLSKKFPGLHVYTGMIDEELNEKGYIVPGLGDAGDRSFGT